MKNENKTNSHATSALFMAARYKTFYIKGYLCHKKKKKFGLLKLKIISEIFN